MTKKSLKAEMDWLMLTHMNDVTEYINRGLYSIAKEEIDKLKGMIYYAEFVGLISCEDWQEINYQLIRLKGKVDLLALGIK